jgi:hypothetical protein
VRGKVASFLARDSQVRAETQAAARRSARRHFLLALSAARPELVRPRLIVCMGMIASGKSTLAEALAERFGIAVLSADRVRKQLLAVPLLTPLPDAAFSGSYAPEISARVYTLLRERAFSLLGSGRSVILDATFQARSERERLSEAAARVGVQLLFLECQCSRESAMERLRQRAQGSHISDGRAEIYDALAAHFEPVNELAQEAHLTLDTDQPWQRTLEQAGRALS